MTTQPTYQVRDARTEKRFFVDNVIIRGYGKAMGAYGVAVYSALCMHANLKTQQCYPAHQTISDLLDCGVGMVKESLRLLADLKLIKIDPRYDKETRRQTSNLYTILEPPPVDTDPPVITDTPPRNASMTTNNPHLDQSYLKEEPPLADSLVEDSPPVEDSDVAFDIAETPETVEFWIEGESPPEPSPQEAAEKILPRLRDEYGIDPLGVASVVVHHRAAVAHPDGGDPSKDGDPWDVAYNAFVENFHPGLDPVDVSETDRRNGRNKIAKLASGAPKRITPEAAAAVMIPFAVLEKWLVKPSTTPFMKSWAEGFKVMLVMDPATARAQSQRNGGASGGRNGRGAQVEGNGFRAMPAAKAAR